MFPNMLQTPLEEILDSDSLYMDIVNYRVSDFMEHNTDCRECEFFRGGWKKRVDELLNKLGVGA